MPAWTLAVRTAPSIAAHYSSWCFPTSVAGIWLPRDRAQPHRSIGLRVGARAAQLDGVRRRAQSRTLPRGRLLARSRGLGLPRRATPHRRRVARGHRDAARALRPLRRLRDLHALPSAGVARGRPSARARAARARRAARSARAALPRVPPRGRRKFPRLSRLHDAAEATLYGMRRRTRALVAGLPLLRCPGARRHTRAWARRRADG